jgi:hypothetical protein
MAVLDMNRAPGEGTVGNLLPTVRARPRQRGEQAAAAGQLMNGMLGGAEQQVRPGIGSRPARQRGMPTMSR